jgi:ABC-type nickel/cobalt efflux system permease component RcnA
MGLGAMTPRVRPYLAAALVAGLWLLPGGRAAAHPLGNFTINRASALRMERGRIAIDYIVDMAEIPALQTRQEIDSDADSAIGNEEEARYRTAECRRIGRGVHLVLDRRPANVDVRGSALSFPPGAAGLPTLRLTCRLDAAIVAPAGALNVDYADENFPGRIGWREITAVADGGVLVSADVPAESLSKGLTIYPQDMLQSPLDQRRAHLRFQPASAGAGPGAHPDTPVAGLGPLSRGADRATQAFTSLVAGRSPTPGFVLMAFAMATLLGAVHALAPGHGKTVMAAYLVGLKGSLRQALAIGLTVTATHTAGVVALGILVSTSSALVPERLYPWLSLASGLLLASVGAGLVVRTLRHRAHAHGHQHDHLRSRGDDARPVGWRSLVTLGLAGGLVPAPSALLVLLAAAALGRAWMGIALVVAYGLGMAATLTGTGLALVHLRASLDHGSRGRHAAALHRVGRLLPLTTAAVVLAVGLLLAARAATQL